MTDRQSARYTHGHHESVLRAHAWRTVDNSAAYLAPHLRAGMRVLDVGSGPGTITVDLARRVAPGTVLGIDASADVVATAAAYAEQEGVTTVEFRTGDLLALDLPDDAFDVTHVHQVLQHVADPVAALRELRRVTKPGGIVAAREVDYSRVIWYPESDGLQQWLDVYLRVHHGNGGDPDAGRKLKAWARAAGLTDIRSSASIWCFASDAERDWWGGAWADRALQSSFAEHARETDVASQADLEAISRAWLAFVDDEDGWFAMPHGEILARA